MSPHKLLLPVILGVFLCASPLYAREVAGIPEKTSPEKFGTVRFPVSCNGAAQERFDRAVAILHSFGYRVAHDAFASVRETDPGCAMSYWGSAMSLWHQIWADRPDAATLSRGWANVVKAKESGGNATDREKGYIAAIEAFYKDFDKRDYTTRALAYEKAMERVYHRFPEDRDAAAFYALALLATAEPSDMAYANQDKAATILEKIVSEVPDHPGAVHYLIHAYDYPSRASRGLAAARRYAQIAPSVPHALHMPSHIFIRLGLWQDAIGSNRAFVAAAKAQGEMAEYLHGLNFLMYSYLQGAQDRQAEEVLKELNATGKVEPETLGTAYHIAEIPARYMVERRRWADAVTLEVQPTRFAAVEAMTHYARALGAARIGEIPKARTEVATLEALRDALEKSKDTYWAGQVEIERRSAAAWLARAKGETEEAMTLMRSAADLEDTTEKKPITPGMVVPARELLGEMLIESGNPGQALVEFEATLAKQPNRFNGLYGAARAAQLAGNTAKARDYYSKLLAVSDHADGDRAQLAEARTFLAKRWN